MNYSKRTVLNYISGNDTDIDIELLEKDYNFMLDTLKFSKDKKILKLCDQSLLNDGRFIYEVLDIFKNDRLFCIELATKYITYNGASYDIDSINVALKAQDINNDRYLVEFTSILLYLKMAYITIKLTTQKQIDDEQLPTSFNYGIILSNYPNDELFKRFMADNMVKDIFSSLNTSLEYYVKSGYNTPNYIENIGSRQFLLDLIRGHDEDLADYVEFNDYLISSKISLLDSIIYDWKKEINNYEDEICDIIQLYSEQHNELCEDTYLKYIAKELNMPNLLDHTFEAMNEDLIELGYKSIDFSDLADEPIDEITKEKLLSKLKKGILLYLANNKKNLYNEVNNQKKLENKIIKFNRNRKDI